MRSHYGENYWIGPQIAPSSTMFSGFTSHRLFLVSDFKKWFGSDDELNAQKMPTLKLSTNLIIWKWLKNWRHWRKVFLTQMGLSWDIKHFIVEILFFHSKSHLFFNQTSYYWMYDNLKSYRIATEIEINFISARKFKYWI